MSELPVPPFFDPGRVGEVWRVPYAARAVEAEAWASEHGIGAAVDDRRRICLVAVDVQNTFCIPGFELYVAGRSGTAAVDDNVRLCEFVYRNLGAITQIVPTLDTHQAMQIFHPVFLVDPEGHHPGPYTLVSAEDVDRGRWRFNEDIAPALGLAPGEGQSHLRHYVGSLERSRKYELTVWPYHSLLGGIGHALVSSIEEAVFFHGLVRRSRPHVEIKGSNPLTEHYSVLGPEVTDGPGGRVIAAPNTALVDLLLGFDAVVIAGQAKSHCVAWTIDDLLTHLRGRDAALARKVYLLEDCTSPVVVPGSVDFTEPADQAFRRFRDAGMHVVGSTDRIDNWPEIPR